MADTGDEDYNNTHRSFVQAFIARSTFTFDEAKPVLAAIFSARRMSLGFERDMSEC